MSAPLEGRLFIDGEFREARSGKRYPIINPADESVVAEAADAGVEDVDDAIAAARRFIDTSDWTTNHEFRKRLHGSVPGGIACSRRRIREHHGRRGRGGARQHVDACAIHDRGHGLLQQPDHRFPWEEDLGPYEVMGNLSERQVRYEPYGVVGAITPWNAPFMTALWKTHHGLATGNAVILKSAPDTRSPRP